MTVDQPVGTGFSYVNTDSYLHELPEVSSFQIVTERKQMAAQFLIFLEKWIELFPEYRDDDVLSYGGRCSQ
jgi:carboxypeptidase D